MNSPRAWRLLTDPRAKSLYRLVAGLGDTAAITLAFLAAYGLRFECQRIIHIFPITKGVPSLTDYLPFLPAMIVLWTLVLGFQRCYQLLNIPLLDELIRLVKASTLSSLLVMAATFLYRGSELSRLTVGMMGVAGAVSLFIWRELLKVVRSRLLGRRPKRILIIGHGPLAAALERVLIKHKDSAILKKRLDNVEVLARTLSRSRFEEVLLADPGMSHPEAASLAAACEEKGIPCRIVPDILELRMGEVIVDNSLGIPTFQLKHIALHGGTFITKRIFDCLISSLILLLLSIPLLIICLLIKLDSPGPIFYKQPRVGYKGKAFTFIKFRTMVKKADDLLQGLKASNERTGPVFKMKEDPRVTRVGRILRRYSLDEIPQLFNVLKGDMSLVGPRPQVLWEANAYDERAKKRLNTLPGVTGLWQVSGRADLTYDEMIDLDLYYLEHWSPGLDLKILLRTLPSIIGGHGAY